MHVPRVGAFSALRLVVPPTLFLLELLAGVLELVVRHCSERRFEQRGKFVRRHVRNGLGGDHAKAYFLEPPKGGL